MLKPLFISCILHLLKYIETHVIQCFAIIFWWFSYFFHISWTINIFTWVNSSTLNLLKPLFKCCILHLLVSIEIHITTQCFTFIFEQVSEFFQISWIINMSWIIHFEHLKSIICELHFALTTIFWNECIKIKHVSYLYLNELVIRSNVHACKV